MPKREKLADWFVYRLGGARAAQIGMVKTANAEAAIAAAIEEYGLDPRDRRRLIAQLA